ncbi:hypothetical protein [Burkholderia gladioli]|uniref:hypothetical protein n=1 Tax=Burkholderia gladioli TaxID=28095 RepID=UPI0016420CC5|nr:hypothetical protein [Burkholderia gladioli]
MLTFFLIILFTGLAVASGVASAIFWLLSAWAAEKTLPAHIPPGTSQNIIDAVNGMAVIGNLWAGIFAVAVFLFGGVAGYLAARKRRKKNAGRSSTRESDLIDQSVVEAISDLKRRFPNMSDQAAHLIVADGRASLFRDSSDVRVEAIEFDADDLPVWPFDGKFGLVMVKHEPSSPLPSHAYWVMLIGSGGLGWSSPLATQGDVDDLLRDLRARGKDAASERMEEASVIRYSSHDFVPASSTDRAHPQAMSRGGKG